jgi:cytochrome c biogenesis protein CcmG/thiol:disulfide interchange protein DsbE
MQFEVRATCLAFLKTPGNARAARRPYTTAVVASLLALIGSLAHSVPADPPLDLSALAGHVVYLDFWASWCVPCRQSFPWMSRMQRDFGQAGFIVVAVNVDHARRDAEQFLREHSPGFRIIFDPDGTLAERFGVKGMPTSFLIDRDGHVHSEHEGFRLKDRGTLEQQIRSLLTTR